MSVCLKLGVADLVLFVAVWSQAQGTFTVTFDGPPVLPPGTARLVQYYSESGVWFLTMPGTDGFGRVAISPNPGRPDNGTAYVQASLGDSLMFGLEDGSSFDPVSVDLAEYSTLFQQPLGVRFVGYRPDGSTVTANMTTDGIIDGTGPLADVETFYFSRDFSGLTRVEIPLPLWSLDNLRLGIPEPGIGRVLLAGALLLLASKARKSRPVLRTRPRL